MLKYTLYQVGGAVRDRLLGIENPKDIDFTVVITSTDSIVDARFAFDWFIAEIKSEGYEVFLVTPEMFTIRAKFPKDHPQSGLVADFVIARKESGFVEGTRRPLRVELGTLVDDLERRDFTVNAIAMDGAGTIIDPFGGVEDLDEMMLRCPVNAVTSFNDDPLRLLRAFRFNVTKGFFITAPIIDAIERMDVDRFKETVSTERIREELDKMFRFDTVRALDALNRLRFTNNKLSKYIFSQIWLKPTTEKK